MMLILSASQPTVSATLAALARGLHHFRVDLLDQVVALLVQLVDVALGLGDRAVALEARLVLLVPQLDIRLRQSRHQGADRLVHSRESNRTLPAPHRAGHALGPGRRGPCPARRYGHQAPRPG